MKIKQRHRTRPKYLPMAPAEFTYWRKQHGLGKLKAAAVLGISINMPAKYENGTRAIPKYLALAMAAHGKGLKPWPLS